MKVFSLQDESDAASPGHGRPMSRRVALGRTAGGLLAVGGGLTPFGPWSETRAQAADPALILRNSRPLDLETPVTALDGRLTPNRLFFVRSHLSTPSLNLDSWQLRLDGLVDRPLALSLDDLGRLEQVTVPGVLQCSGNGRANFRPRVPGVQWERGAVGHAEWSGVRLADLLRKAGFRRGAAHVHILGADAPPAPKTPVYIRSLPIDRALDSDIVVATRMNGEPLPFLHGGPIRLVVPTWTGNHWMKWLRLITVSETEAPGTYQQSGYKIPKTPAPPGAVLKPTDLVPLTVMNVKSLITFPADGTVLKPGKNQLRGVAWTGAGHVTRLEFATAQGGPWSPATLHGDDRQGAWRTWTAEWQAERPGKYTLRARATDSHGETQPEVTPWNRSGYLWNGIDQVTCEVS